jgi:hypothetical protein
LALGVTGEDDLKGFIAASIATATDAPLLDPDTAMPLVPHDAKTGRPVPIAGGKR